MKISAAQFLSESTSTQRLALTVIDAEQVRSNPVRSVAPHVTGAQIAPEVRHVMECMQITVVRCTVHECYIFR